MKGCIDCGFIMDEALLRDGLCVVCTGDREKAKDYGSYRVQELTKEVQGLKVALHDAIRRPMGVVPDSASRWYDHGMADDAEKRMELNDEQRRRQTDSQYRDRNIV